MAGNANSGRRGDPATVHLLRGTFRADRHAQHDTPEPPKGRPEPPKALSPAAKAEWDRMLERLERCGTLTVVDDGALYQYCQMFAETEEHAATSIDTIATVKLLEAQLVNLKGPDLLAAFVEIGKLRKLQARYAVEIRSGRMGLRQWLAEFGLTPATRTRVKITPAKRQSKVEQFRATKGDE